MLPVSIFMGLVVGGTLRRPVSVRVAMGILVVSCLLWGAVAGTIATDLSTGLRGVILAAANSAAGVAVALIIRWLVGMVASRIR